MGPYRTPQGGPSSRAAAPAAEPGQENDLALGLLACGAGLLPLAAALLAGGGANRGAEVGIGLLLLLFGTRVLVQGWRRRRRALRGQS